MDNNNAKKSISDDLAEDGTNSDIDEDEGEDDEESERHGEDNTEEIKWRQAELMERLAAAAAAGKSLAAPAPLHPR